MKEPPVGDLWLHELKFDGYRMLCRIDRGKVTVWSRNEKEWTGKFTNVEESVKALPVTTAILDGEIVVVDAHGQSSFQKLQRAMGKSVNSGFVYELFDLIYLDGYDLTRVPLKERKRILKELCAGSRGTIRFSEHFEGNGDAFFKNACEYGIEGIVSKLADSTYDSTRNRSWLKVKCNKQQEFVIAGYTPTEKGLLGFGALILGVYEKGKLVYAGRVGTGFTFKERGDLKKQLLSLSRPSTPFAVTPKSRGLREAVWVEPKLIVEVIFAEWTSDGSIRHPSFHGLREDKKAKDVIREVPNEQVAIRSIDFAKPQAYKRLPPPNYVSNIEPVPSLSLKKESSTNEISSSKVPEKHRHRVNAHRHRIWLSAFEDCAGP